MFGFVSLEIIVMATWVIAFWAVVHFSSEYMRRCFFSSPSWINDFPHSLHWCGLYPEWESKCKFSTRWISTFCTFVHFLPSVDIICVFRKTAWPNDFLQLEHVLALTPLWVSVRVFRIPAWPNDICQWSQDNDFNIQVIYKIQIHYPMYYVCTKRLHFIITCKLQYWLRYSQKALKTDRGWCTWQF